MTTLTSCRSDRNFRINCCKQIKYINKDNSWKQRNNIYGPQSTIHPNALRQRNPQDHHCKIEGESDSATLCNYGCHELTPCDFLI
ncbi:unnamed protein product [Arabidopsis halleri]